MSISHGDIMASSNYCNFMWSVQLRRQNVDGRMPVGSLMLMQEIRKPEKDDKDDYLLWRHA